MSKALKIIGISALFMVVVFVAAAYALIGKFSRDVEGIRMMQAARNKEVQRILALPELRGVLVGGDPVEAPFTRVPVAACLLIQGRRIQWSGPSGGRSTGPSDRPKYDFEDDEVVLRGQDLRIAINGNTYPFVLDSLIRSRAVGANGTAGETFESNSIFNLADPDRQADLDRVRLLAGKSGLIDRYLARDGKSRSDVSLQEVLFQFGDTISFRGRIADGSVLALF
ncbi:MAG: hypothetical protein JNM62_10155 [Flavobacteriales bacterium]|nr:hypothetical protein [Flavobacteriales bacterium]